MRNDELLERLIQSKETIEIMIIHAETALEHDRRFKSINFNRDDAAYRDAVLMQLGQVGEACSYAKLPDETASEYDHIDWRQINGFRNHAYHEYEKLDYDLAWYIVDELLETLVTDLLDIVDDLNYRIDELL